MGKGGGTETSTTTSTAAPPDFITDFLQSILGRAQTSSQDPRQFFPGSTVTPFDPATQAALGNLEQLGLAGPSDLVAGGEDLLQRTIGGEFLEPSSLIRGAQSAIDRFIPQSQGQFGLGGRSGSGLAANQLSQGITDAVQDQFNVERGFQQDALGRIGDFEAFRTIPDQILAQVGAKREGQAGQQIAEDVARFQFGQGEEDARIGQFANILALLGGLAGGTTTGQATRPDQGGFGFGDLLGLGGSLLGGAFGGPAGAAAGGAVGGGTTGGGLGGFSIGNLFGF